MATRKKTYKGDDLGKTGQDRKVGGGQYEPWEKKKKAGKKTSTRGKRATGRGRR
jgi:hypothetical protein